MKDLLVGAVLAGAGICTLSCGGGPGATAAAYPSITPGQLDAHFQNMWTAVDGGKSRPYRELAQLGLPTETTLTVWHLLAREQGDASPISVDGQPVSEACMRRWQLGGLELHDKQKPSGTFPAERIEIGCLRPDVTRHIVKVGSVTLVASTAPRANDLTPFSFLAWSCNNLFANRNRTLSIEVNKLNSLALLAARSRGDIWPDGQPERPSFGVAVGDQIYVDGDNETRAPADTLALFVGNGSKPRFDTSQSGSYLDTIYRYHLSVPPLDDALETVPTAMVWDDHEIRDGWRSHGDEDGADFAKYFPVAREAFISYQHLRNPNVHGEVPTPEALAAGKAAMDVRFGWGKLASVYLIDGRTNRQYAKTPDHGRILSPPQFEEICKWLGEEPGCANRGMDRFEPPIQQGDQPRLFVLGSPSPLSTNEKKPADWFSACSSDERSIYGEGEDDIRDTWFCNKPDRTRLLSLLARHFLRHPLHRLLVVSGDVHWSGVTSLQYINEQGVKNLFGYEVISSGITNDHHKNGTENFGAWEAALLARGAGTMIQSTAHGAINDSPSFAEIQVVPSPRWAPALSVIFYPSRASRTTGEKDTRSLVNYWRTLEQVHEVREFDYSSNIRDQFSGPFFTRIPLPRRSPLGVGASLHQVSVVCDAWTVDSAASATEWYDSRAPSTCAPPKD